MSLRLNWSIGKSAAMTQAERDELRRLAETTPRSSSVNLWVRELLALLDEIEALVKRVAELELELEREQDTINDYSRHYD